MSGEGRKLFEDANASLDRMMTAEERENLCKVVRIAEECAAQANAELEAMFRKSGLAAKGFPQPYLCVDLFPIDAA